MKKINQKGFVLAETLVVTVFLMIIFTMIYQNFYPLIGEYEKRENYNDIDSTYSIYWIKKLIEDPSYRIESPEKKLFFQQYGFVRFECSDIVDNDNQKKTCVDLVKALEISNCNKDGNYCDIFITDYKIGGEGSKFKTVAIQDSKSLALKRYHEEGSQDAFVKKCLESTCPDCVIGENTNSERECIEKSEKKIFSSGFQDYVKLLPDYTTPSLNNAKYRVIAIIHHHKDNNNYYTYSTMEVNKQQTAEEAAAAASGKTYTLTYANDPENTCIPPAIIVNGEDKTWNSAGTLCTPTRKGYTFLSWNTKADGSGTTFTGDEVATNDITVYAQYQKNQVKIKFNTNGGVLAAEHHTKYSLSGDNVILNNETDIIQTIDYGDKMDDDGLANYNNKNYLNIEKTGYRAVKKAEWNTMPDGSGTSFNQSEGGIQDSRFCDASEADCTVTLYVNWESAVYTATLDKSGGTGGTDKIYEKLNNGWYSDSDTTTPITKITKPTRTGYDFDGYYTETNGGGTKIVDASENIVAGNTELNSDKTLYAKWNIGIYAITLDKRSGTGGTNTVYEKYNTGWYSNATATDSLTKITPPTRTGYTFAGYYTATSGGTKIINADGTFVSGKTTQFTANGNLYARWSNASYTFKINASGTSGIAYVKIKKTNTTITDGTCKSSDECGTTVSGVFISGGTVSKTSDSTSAITDITYSCTYTRGTGDASGTFNTTKYSATQNGNNYVIKPNLAYNDLYVIDVSCTAQGKFGDRTVSAAAPVTFTMGNGWLSSAHSTTNNWLTTTGGNKDWRYYYNGSFATGWKYLYWYNNSNQTHIAGEYSWYYFFDGNETASNNLCHGKKNYAAEGFCYNLSSNDSSNPNKFKEKTIYFMSPQYVYSGGAGSTGNALIWYPNNSYLEIGGAHVIRLGRNGLPTNQNVQYVFATGGICSGSSIGTCPKPS